MATVSDSDDVPGAKVTGTSIHVSRDVLQRISTNKSIGKLIS